MTAPEPDPIDIAIRVAKAIEGVSGTYFVGGSVASSLQGDPRATNDIDFIVSLPVGGERALRDALGADFELDVDALHEALRRSSSMNAFFLPLLTKIDLFGLGREPYDQMEFSRRRPVAVRSTGETLVVKSPEDTVLRKLLWYRAGGEVSDKQWRDVVSVLRVSSAVLDPAYLGDWSQRLSCADLLARARADAAR